MAVPVLVQAGTGTTITTGTGTHSITGCTAGNLIMLHFMVDGTTYDISNGTHTNWENLAGTANSHSTILDAASIGSGAGTANHSVYLGRATANGTVSLDQTVGASGEDIFGRFFEFSGVTTAQTVATVIENGAGTEVDQANTSASVADGSVATNGTNRLALNFVAINASQVTAAFTGQTGGTWVEAATFIGGGTVGTIQLQTASMASAGTIDGGTYAITSAAWGIIGTALIPAPSVSDHPSVAWWTA